MLESTVSPGTAGHVSYRLDTAATDQAGNLISYKGWSADPTPVLIRRSTFTYDNKPNPFAILSNYKTLEIFPGGETFIDEMQAKNNRLHANEKDAYGNVTFDEDLTGRYIYKSNGLPASVSQPGFGGTFKTIFIYRSL